jgi:DNA polymerase epsilon subunit 3
MPRKETNTGPISAQAQQDLVSEGIENFELPKSIVTKIAKSAIPEHAKLQKETVLSLLKGSTVFINYLSATAHGVAVSKQHKSISATDVLKALELIEFGDLVEMLQGELQIYRDNNKGDKGKKGASTSNSAVVSASTGKSVDADSCVSPTPTSVSTVGKSKGKEKERTVGLGSPFTSVPRSGIGPDPDYGADGGARPQDEEMMETGPLEEDEGVEEEDVADEEEVAEEEDVEEDAEEEVDDEGDGNEKMEMAVEEEERWDDAK